MKKKLKTVFILIVLSLAGIIVFQSYWTFNSYKVNKERFDGNIDSAMRLAMEDCKKDYFDSIRVVIVKGLSSPKITIKIDTLPQSDSALKYLSIILSSKDVRPDDSIRLYNNWWEFYGKKINHKPTVPEVLTEMSFYVPYVLNDIETRLMFTNMPRFDTLKKTHPNLSGTDLGWLAANENMVMKLPPNYKQADSLKLSNYLNIELHKMHIYAPFDFIFSVKSTSPQKQNLHYSETNEYVYKYHGFVGLGHMRQDKLFYARATFRRPQYAVLKSMLITLVLSLLLIVLTIYCFLYITRTILEQKKLADLKDDFINNMTHELKTPIATITVAIEGLQKFNVLNDPEKTQRYLQTSRDELNRLNELVSKVLNMAVFENKEITLVKEKINVDELLNDAITSEKSKTTKAVNITYTKKDIETIEADKFHFRNVLVNLVDNAIKYSDEPADIGITCYKAGNNIAFSVKDKGIGIPPEHINQVFDKFHRVPTGNVHNVKGTGLGLSYVRYIAEAHGGSVTVKSEINAGSEFIVTLPLTNG